MYGDAIYGAGAAATSGAGAGNGRVEAAAANMGAGARAAANNGAGNCAASGVAIAWLIACALYDVAMGKIAPNATDTTIAKTMKI